MSRNSTLFVDPKASLWVSAHAGAGKTRVLIDRVARLLIAGTPPEQILCLTFTKAAAAEMAQRLSQALGQLALSSNEALTHALVDLHVENPESEQLQQARRQFARALETPGGLKIQTIHAFCERLLGRFPIEAGIAPGFTILDERTASEMIREAQARMLCTLRDDADREALRVLARMGNDDRLTEIVRQLMVKRRELAGEGLTLRAEPDQLAHALGLMTGDTPQSLERAFLAQIPLADLKRAVWALAQGKRNDQSQAKQITAMIHAPGSERTFYLDQYLQTFLTDGGAERKRILTVDLAAAFPDVEKILALEQARALSYLKMQRAARTAEHSRAALRIGIRIIDIYEAQKRARSALDYDDLIEKSVELFRRNSADWVLYKLDHGLSHILVDEAQDTNPLQWRVITALSEEFFSGKGARSAVRTIFAVGDEKQSIYRFQGADPKIFGRMEEHFIRALEGAGRRLETPLLNETRRSSAAILRFVDTVFDDETLRLRLSARLQPLRHKVFREGQAGLVELWPLVRPDPSAPPAPWNVPLDYEGPASDKARLARLIADKIKHWLESKEHLASLGRAIRPGDIMVLFRKRDALVDELIRALKLRAIPVAGSDRLALTAHIAVMDLIALGHFALLPEDDLTLATVLKSPFFGLSEELLFGIAHDRPGSLWDALRVRAEPVCRDAVQRLSALIARAPRESPASFYAYVLGPFGGRRQILARLGADAEDPIEELLRAAYEFERDHPPVLQSFLHWLQSADSEIKRDMDQAHDEVRLLTVHGSKGLEANIVILPDTCTLPHARSESGFYLLSPREATTRIPVYSQRAAEDPELVTAAREAERNAADAEHLRLLYVALTRARDRLYICGHGSKDPPELSWYALARRAMAALGRPAGEIDGESVLRYDVAQSAAPDGERRRFEPAPAPSSLPGWAVSTARSEAPFWRALSPSALIAKGAPAGSASLRESVSLDKQRFKRGRLIHRLLEILPELDHTVREDHARRLVRQRRYELPEPDQDEIVAAVLRVLDEPAFAALFAAGSRAEVPVAGVLAALAGPIQLFGVIDRMAVTRDEVLIVDYKTNREPPSDLEAVPKSYIAQMAAYFHILSMIYPDRRIRGALLWTEGPQLMALPSSLLMDTWRETVSAS